MFFLIFSHFELLIGENCDYENQKNLKIIFGFIWICFIFEKKIIIEANSYIIVI